MKRMQKARAEKLHATKGQLIQFIPGGFYWLRDDILFTGVNNKVAAWSVQERYIALANKAAQTPGEWVTR